MAEFAATNNKSAFIKLCPFFVSKDLDPCISFDIVDFYNASICEQILKEKVLDISGNRLITQEFAQNAIAISKKKQSKQVNKPQNNIFYIVKDRIWLSTRNVTTDEHSQKLDHKMFRFFHVIGNKKVSIKLQVRHLVKI